MDILDIKINLKLRFKILIIGVLATSIAAIITWIYSEESNAFENVIKILQIGLTFFALVYTAASINESAKINENTSILKKKEKTLEYVDRFRELDEKGITNLSKTLRGRLKDKDIKEFNQILKDNPKEKIALLNTLNFFESLAIAIDHGIADEDVAYSSFKSIVLDHRRRLIPFIEKYRMEYNSKSYLEHFTNLADKWSDFS